MLCADRVDYSLREFPKRNAKFCLNNLTVFDGKIVFKNKKAAKIFAFKFLDLQKLHWGSFEANSRWFIFANLLKYAMDKKIIKFSDFDKYDKYIIERLEKSKDEKISKTLKILTNKSLKNFPLSKVRQKRKFRRVDPQFLEKEKLWTLGEIDKSFQKRLLKSKKLNELGTKTPILPYFEEVS
ncbi:MAG: hypothetical protein HY344_01815 [Candidatus Levybacteria bacterium]|nr:hypothetical protein [Candidatus Levybacteria bacterium]